MWRNVQTRLVVKEEDKHEASVQVANDCETSETDENHYSIMKRKYDAEVEKNEE